MDNCRQSDNQTRTKKYQIDTVQWSRNTGTLQLGRYVLYWSKCLLMGRVFAVGGILWRVWGTAGQAGLLQHRTVVIISKLNWTVQS